ncbi:MAG: glycoside hydrolase family 5 protein [Roseburia sp.]|nr:glycoside hydrolase family 5 protein [Roseburia sp.]
MKRKLFCLLAVFCLGAVIFLMPGCAAQKESEAMKFVAQMGNGINLGNSLDSTGLREYEKDADDLAYETFWGNPVLTREQFHAVKDAGFGTVRIPVTWEDHMDKRGTVSSQWMDRVDEVVRMALEEDLYVILDTHHEDWLDLDAGNRETAEEKFALLWEQIALNFADCGEKLLFEGLNEPRKRDSAHEWDLGTEESREMLNELNQIFVDTVRRTGENNETRYLLLDSYASNPISGGFDDFEIPKDSRIIVSIHAYFPYDFCQNMGEGAAASFDRENKRDTEELEAAFANASQKFVEKEIPVILTEFGCVDKSNDPSRREWLLSVMEFSGKYQIPCLWWDDGKDYKLLDRNSLQWNEELLKTFSLFD